METRYIVIAVVIVFGVILLLAYQPTDNGHIPTDRPRVTDRITELPHAADDTPIATVELAPPPPIADQPEGAAADMQLIRGFEAERADPAWAPIATERLGSIIVPEVESRGGTVSAIECRQTACRVRLEFPNATARPVAVNELMTVLAERRHVALIERVQENRVTLLVAP